MRGYTLDSIASLLRTNRFTMCQDMADNIYGGGSLHAVAIHLSKDFFKTNNI